jgi:flagellin-like hook-associated protein FlgL
MSNIALSAGVRANLLSLQNTASLMQTTQTDLATGNKVNSALDNPLSFFTAQSLNTRADALNGLLDAMSNGVQTIQAANNGITSITSMVQQLQSIVSQARGDTSSNATTPGTATAVANSSSQTNNTLTFNIGGGVNVGINTYTHTNATVSTLTSSGGTFGTDLSAASFKINDGTTNATITFQSSSKSEAAQIADINSSLATAGSTVQAVNNGGQIQLVNSTGKQITVTADATAAADLGFTTGQQSTDGAVATNQALTNAQLASAINSDTALSGIVSASVDTNGHLVLSNLSTTTAIGVTGYNGTNVTGNSADSSSIAAGTSGSISSVRQTLMNQFNNLLTQINQTAGDSGYNGTNLLNGDTMTLKFNENGTSSFSVEMTDANGNKFAINASNLGIVAGTSSQFASNSQLDTLTSTLQSALTTLQTQSTAISSSLSVVQSRQDFTKNMVNTLQTGADNLVLADPNQEGANLLALQTRQSLSTSALSMAAQAQSAVLRLFQ